jgi:hypothetical protein
MVDGAMLFSASTELPLVGSLTVFYNVRQLLSTMDYGQKRTQNFKPNRA